jgi:outer membrane biosynthesis protein TonB
MKLEPDSFSRFILISLGFHLAIFVLLTVKILFFPSDTPEYTRAMRVDVVALPEKQVAPPQPEPTPPRPTVNKEKPKSKPEPPKPKPKPKKVVTKKPVLPKPKKKKVEEKQVKEEQNSALARLRALQKLKNKDDKAGGQPLEYKGNELSKGNSLTGLAKLHHQDYLDQLDSHIRSYWNLPEWLADGNLRASVLLLISRNGAIRSKSFVLKSGNDLFDQHVFSTLDKASPLPTPPPDLINFYATKGVEIRFPE